MTGQAGSRNRHATLVTLEDEGSWRGVLIEGASGTGKTSLAMGLIETFRRAGQGAFLVSDDQVLVERSNGRLTGHAPRAIAGNMEVRGHGIVETEFRESAEISLVVRLVRDDEIERMPEPASAMLEEIELPLVKVPERHEAQAVRIVQAAISGRHF